MTTAEKFFVLDGSALMYKAYFAMITNPMTTSKGFNVSAVYGIVNQILSIITKERPDYLIVAFDAKGPTFRHDIYEPYKATRAKMPEDLVEQIPYVKDIITSLHIPLLEMSGWEADDIIGTIALKAKEKDAHLYIVSGDKDFMQLIDDQTSMYTIKKGQEVDIISYAGVKEKFNCHPNQVIDVLAMMGDASDNVPGIQGIGPKTAQKFIEIYGSLEILYQNVADLKGKQKEKVIASKDLAFLSKELVTIKRDCPIDIDWDHWKFNLDELSKNPKFFEICEELEFKTLSSRVSNIAKGNFYRLEAKTDSSQATEDKVTDKNIPAPSTTTKTKKSKPSAPQDDITAGSSYQANEVEYQMIANKDEWQKCLQQLKKASFIVVDTETSSLDTITCQLAGVSFCIKEKQAWYLPMNVDGFTSDTQTKNEVLKEVKELLENPSIGKGGQNLKYDYKVLLKENIRIHPIHFDTMVAAHLVNQRAFQIGLDALAEQFLQYTKIPTSALIGEGVFEVTMLDLAPEKVAIYACEDVDITMRLKNIFEKDLENMGMKALFEKIEMPLISVLGEMENNGMFINKEVLQSLEKEFDEVLSQLTKEAHELAGRTFNLDSPKELGFLMFEELKIHQGINYKPKKTKTGYSTSADVLDLLGALPLPKIMREYRTIKKLQSTYVTSLPKMINEKTNRIHSHFNQTVAATGRLSSDNPNLQNIPIKGSEGRRIRKAFQPQTKESILISADYSQIELRVLAQLAQDQNMLDAFKADTDIHTSTASKIFGKPKEEISKEDRSRAKAINFGIIYGMGPSRLARENNISQAEAKKFIENYKKTFPKIDTFFEEKIKEARDTEFVSTFFGRKRYLQGINATGFDAVAATNMAKNTPIQGTAAEIIKLAMIQIQQKIQKENLPIKLIGQVHDELLFEADKDFLDEAKTFIRKEMMQVVKWDVELVVDIGVGENWLEAH